MKTLLKAVAASALALQVAAPAFAEDIKLRFAGVFPIDHQGTKMMEQVAAEVNAAGVGLDMTVFPASLYNSYQCTTVAFTDHGINFPIAYP